MAAFWVVFFLIMGLGFVIAFTRKGKVASDTIGSRSRDVFTPADPETVFRVLAALRDAKISVDDSDPATKRLVLSSPVTFFSWGFLYPVEIRGAATGSHITVGCKSKFFQLGPLVTRAHDNCVAVIEAALSVPQARVA